jgi:polysaccharide export outer membrane protein
MSSRSISGTIVLLLAAGCALVARAKVKPEPEAPPRDVAVQLPEYRMGPEDIIEISVWKNEGVGRTIPVRPDGMISLPLLNDVQAAGLTPMELRHVLREKLTVYIPNPEVSVIVREVHSAKVSVFGEVVHPGRYELRGPTRVLEILAQAGGLNAFASRSNILVLRPNGSRTERIRIDHDRLVSDKGEKSEDSVVLRSGDVVFVP